MISMHCLGCIKKKKYNATLFSKNWIKPRDLEKSIYFKRIVPKITLSNFKEAHEDTDLELHKSQPGFQPRGGAGRSPWPGEPWNERIRQTAWLTPSLSQRKEGGGGKESNLPWSTQIAQQFQYCHQELPRDSIEGCELQRNKWTAAKGREKIYRAELLLPDQTRNAPIKNLFIQGTVWAWWLWWEGDGHVSGKTKLGFG